MAIVKKNDFYFLDGLSSDFIIVEDKKTKEYVNYINDNHVQAISILYDYYSSEDIDFLRECPNVKKINVISPYLKNYEGLKYLKHLQELQLDEPKGKVDVSKFEELKELIVSINKM